MWILVEDEILNIENATRIKIKTDNNIIIFWKEFTYEIFCDSKEDAEQKFRVIQNGILRNNPLIHL